jgi:two-component system, OmpR family, response regulator
MLVIARRVQESLVFPSVEATVRVVAVRAGSVRLGIEAPPEVTVLRAELCERTTAPREVVGARRAPAQAGPARQEHFIRNRLNNITLALGMLRRRLAPGAQGLLDRVAEECRLLREQLEGLLGAEAAPSPQPGQPAPATRRGFRKFIGLA